MNHIANPWTSRVGNAEISTTAKQLIKNNHFQADDQWLLVYNTDLYRQRLRYLKSHFPADSLHTLAIKSCPLISILKIAVDESFGLEAASLEEVKLALAAGCEAKNIIFDSPVKTRQELDYALQKGIRINADNFDELERIQQIRQANSLAPIGLRINPEVGEGDIKMTSVAGGASKFGLSLALHKEEILEAYGKYSWLNGLHIHVGSQGCNIDLLTSAATVIDQLKTQINQQAKCQRIKWIDIGGGLPSDYGFNTKAIDAEHYVSELKKATPSLFEQPLLTENGRSILANCAWAISRIEYIKPHQDKLTATIHFGADFMMRPVYAPNDWQHDYLILNEHAEISHANKIELSIAGPLCFSGDYLTKNQLMTTPKNEDFIVAKDVGAYTLSTWSRHCNRRLPKVLGYESGEIKVLFKGESFDDVINFWR